MSSPALRIGFMGTPEFAAVHLTRLLDAGRKVVCVVTQPDRRRGRGRKVHPPPVKTVALERGIPVIQIESFRETSLVEQMAAYRPDAWVVVAFGLLLPRFVLELPPLGSINVHASLLPRLRGAAPIQWAIIRGESVTGVTTIRMDQGLDTGDILLQKETAVRPDDTAQTLHDRLAVLGAEVLLETLDALEAGTLTPVPQDHSKATYAPMLRKEDGRIRWNESAEAINNRIRGLDPWPGAYTFVSGKRLRLFGGSFEWREGDEVPGTVLGITERGLQVAAGKGAVLIRELQLQGRKRLPAIEFLRGFPLPPGTVLNNA